MLVSQALEVEMSALAPADEPDAKGPVEGSASMLATHAGARGFTLFVPSKALRRGLGLGLVALFLIVAVAQFADGLPEADWAFGIIAITSLDYRGNIANWWLTSALFLCAMQLAALAALRRSAAPRPALHCGLLAGLLLLASLIGFTDFVERLSLWLPAAEALDSLIFWSALVAVPLLLPRLLGQSFHSSTWRFLVAAAAALCVLCLVLGLEATERLALRIWYDAGGSESHAGSVIDLLALGRMMLRLLLAAVVSLVLLDKLAAVAGSLRVDSSRWS